jgi:t-SNARE complex subunit (syntaxin)
MREKKVLKLLKKAMKQDHLYSNEELEYMREQLKVVESHLKEKEVQNYKGFGKK